MKRFGFDWENNRALKFDDYFKFPFILNMEPYTVEGVTKRESFVEYDDLVTNTTGMSSSSSSTATGKSKLTVGPIYCHFRQRESICIFV